MWILPAGSGLSGKASGPGARRWLSTPYSSLAADRSTMARTGPPSRWSSDERTCRILIGSGMIAHVRLPGRLGRPRSRLPARPKHAPFRILIHGFPPPHRGRNNAALLPPGDQVIEPAPAEIPRQVEVVPDGPGGLDGFGQDRTLHE